MIPAEGAANALEAGTALGLFVKQEESCVVEMVSMEAVAGDDLREEGRWDFSGLCGPGSGV